MRYIKKGQWLVNRVFALLIPLLLLVFNVKGNEGINFQINSLLLTGNTLEPGKPFSTALTNLQSFRANLYIPTPGGDLMADGILVDYEAMYSNAVDYDDALKMYNGSENVGLRRDGSMLSIERRNTMGIKDTLYLNISGMRVQQYRWVFMGIDIAANGRLAYLVDNFLGISTQLNLANSTAVNFMINGSPGSYAYNRFMVVFEQAAIVPVTFTSISAIRNNLNQVTLNWKVENEINIEQYSIERSNDGRRFMGIGITNAFGNNGNSMTYNKYDNSPLNGDNFYRIKASSFGGLVQYSVIVKVAQVKQGFLITVAPNPVQHKTMQLHIRGMNEGSYQARLFDAKGQLVFSSSIAVSGSIMTKSIQLPWLLASGPYKLLVTGIDGTANRINVFVD